MWCWSLLFKIWLVCVHTLVDLFVLMAVSCSCGSTAAHCSLARLLSRKEPVSLEGKFQSQARYYNETKAGSDYSTCGFSRTFSMKENNETVYTAALNQARFDPYTKDGIPSTNPICYRRAIVKGSQGEIMIRFVDRCFDCQQGGSDVCSSPMQYDDWSPWILFR